MPKILYFEDDTFMAGMYATKLRMAGFEVIHRTSPVPDSIPLAHSARPDLIFTDIIMPGLDGFALVQLLKADQRTKQIPVFGMSNLGQADDIAKAKELGMDAYWVSYEHTPTEVVDKIQRLLQGRREDDDFPAPRKPQASEKATPEEASRLPKPSRSEEGQDVPPWRRELMSYMAEIDKRSMRAETWAGGAMLIAIVAGIYAATR